MSDPELVMDLNESESPKKSSNNCSGSTTRETSPKLDNDPTNQVMSLMEDDHIDEMSRINAILVDIEKTLEDEKIENERASKPSISDPNSELNLEGRKVTASNAHQNDKTRNLLNTSTPKSNSKTHKHSKKNSSHETAIDKRSTERKRNDNKTAHQQDFKYNSKSAVDTIPHNIAKLDSVKLNNSRASDETTFEKDLYKEPLESISSTRECGTTTSIGTITEPDCLGPCEPGTSVSLEGIVWQETDSGILAVNVTWRKKSYVGALLDCTKYDWAPPRLCYSPASDTDTKTSKGVRAKRIMTRSNGMGVDGKNLLQTTGKLRNGKGRRLLSEIDSAGSSAKKQRENNQSSETIDLPSVIPINDVTNSKMLNHDIVEAAPPKPPQASNIYGEQIEENPEPDPEPNSPMLISCTEPDCFKKYRTMNGLTYHRTRAHGNNNNNESSRNSRSHSPMNKSKINDSIDHSASPRAKEEITNIIFPSSIKKESSNGCSTSKRSPHEAKLEPSSVKMISVSDRNSSGSVRNRDNIMRIQDVSSERIADVSNRPPSKNAVNLEQVSKPDSSNSAKPNSMPYANNMQGMPPASISLEEGMKPSGISTGPPPAPHSGSFYLNQLYNNSLAAYNFDSFQALGNRMKPPTPNFLADPAFLSRFMLGNFAGGAALPIQSSTMPTQSDPPRLSSPSLPKNLVYPHMPPVPPPSVVSSGVPPLMPPISPQMSMQLPLPQLPPPPSQPGGRQPRMTNPSLPPFWPRLP